MCECSIFNVLVSQDSIVCLLCWMSVRVILFVPTSREALMHDRGGCKSVQELFEREQEHLSDEALLESAKGIGT